MTDYLRIVVYSRRGVLFLVSVLVAAASTLLGMVFVSRLETLAIAFLIVSMAAVFFAVGNYIAALRTFLRRRR